MSRCFGHIPLLAAAILVLAFPAKGNAETGVEQLARWQLNTADLLVDEGKYMEAVEYIASAYENSRHDKTRSDALLAKAMVLATFLDAPEEAEDTYRQLASEFPAQAETAAYQAAFLMLQAAEKERARDGFQSYLRQYPAGRYRLQAEAMLGSLDKPAVDESIAPIPPRKHPVLRVALARKARKVTLVADGLCVDGLGCADTVVVEPAGNGLRINGRQVNNGRAVIRSSVPLKVTVWKRSKRVRGYVSVENKGGRLLVLNHVDIEDYLLSVVPSESYSSWPMETLKAQAVAARTYAYYQKLHRAGRDYDIVDDTRDQMYGGVARETTRTTKAVHRTAGMVLSFRGRPILSQYTANSGGHTADAGAIFGAPKPYLVAHADPASLTGKMASWTRRYTTAEVINALRKIGVDARGLRAMEPAAVGPSGRLIKVRLVHAGGSTVLRTRTTLAGSRALNLPEVLMHIEKNGNAYVFRGRGHGHGVGYSQWGAAELGKTQTHADILAFYYPSTTLERKWN